MCQLTTIETHNKKPEIDQRYLKLSTLELQFYFLDKALDKYIDKYCDYIQGLDWEKLNRQRNLKKIAESEKEFMKDWEYELIAHAIDFQIEKLRFASEPNISFPTPGNVLDSVLNWKSIWNFAGVQIDYIIPS